MLVAAVGIGAPAGAQVPTCFGRPATIVAVPNQPTVGTPGPDVIVGTSGADVIRGRQGNDLICGRGGDDEIEGNRGRDRIKGGSGADTIRGGPGADGSTAPDLAEKLRITQPHLKVLYMSGYTDTDMAQQDLMDEVAGYLQKPFHSSELVREVRRLLDEERG